MLSQLISLLILITCFLGKELTLLAEAIGITSTSLSDRSE